MIQRYRKTLRVLTLVSVQASVAMACSGGDDTGQNEQMLGTGEESGVRGNDEMTEDPGGEGTPSTQGPEATGDPATDSIGKPCESDADCGGDAYCQKDYEFYTQHNTCVTSCTAVEQCEGKYGDEFKCIGAEVCVRRCSADSECPEGSTCDDFGSCTNPAGQPTCTGVATPCGLLSDLDCIVAPGCVEDSECTGVVSSCFSQFSSFACNDLEGCFWSSLSESCSGSARSCSAFTSSIGCTFQDGCNWSSSCTGVADSCESHNHITCESQPGCVAILP